MRRTWKAANPQMLTACVDVGRPERPALTRPVLPASGWVQEEGGGLVLLLLPGFGSVESCPTSPSGELGSALRVSTFPRPRLAGPRRRGENPPEGAGAATPQQAPCRATRPPHTRS